MRLGLGNTLAISTNTVGDNPPAIMAPVISSPDTATGTVGTAFSYQIVASGDPTLFATS